MKTKYSIDGNTVTMERDDLLTEKREIVSYFVPYNGGYVRIRDKAGQFPQVCKNLSGSGETLWCDSSEKLPELIRREWRRALRAERAELRKR